MYRWLEEIDNTTLQDRYLKLEKLNIPFDPYLPIDYEQRRVLLGLPIFRPFGSYPGQKGEAGLASIKHPVVDPSRLRQTTIDRFFKPMKRESAIKQIKSC